MRLPDWVNQRRVMQCMLDKGVASRRGIMCIHREIAYDRIGTQDGLRRSEEAQDRCLILPMFAQMSDEQAVQVIDVLKGAIEQDEAAAAAAFAS